MSTSTATPPLRTNTPARDRRPLKGMGYGMVAGTLAGALAGAASMALFALLVLAIAPIPEASVPGSVVAIAALVAFVVGAGIGLVAGTIAGLLLGATRLERFAPAAAALVSGVIGAQVMDAMYAANNYPDDFHRLAILIIGFADALIGLSAGCWFKRRVERP